MNNSEITVDPLAALTPETSSAVFARLRETHPIYWSRWLNGWVLTRYSHTLEALRNQNLQADNPISRLERLESRGGISLDNFKAILSTISFFTIPPDHDQIRRFLSKVFQKLDLASLPAQLALRATVQLETGRLAGQIDLAADFGRDLALYAIHKLLGIPLPDCHAVAEMARAVALYFDAAPRPLGAILDADKRLGGLLQYFRDLIHQRRLSPSNDGLSWMIRLAEDDLGVDDLQLAGFCAFFFVAGEETTATAISRAMVMLAQRPDLRANLVAQPALVPKAAKEFLRLTSSFQYVVRVPIRDLKIGSHEVRSGQNVVVVLAAANRDPEAFPDPDSIRFDRSGPEALAFGYGAYRCLGARMATIELEAAILALSRVPDIQLAEPALSEMRLRVPALASARARFATANSETCR